MDHMMPEMDGVETTKIMRGMGYGQPIVALTANAVAGQAEIFRGNGFDDFISKPIDIRQLNAVLNRLIRDRQPPEVVEAARKSAETKKWLAAGGARQTVMDSQFAEVFFKDALKTIVALEEIHQKSGYTDKHNLRSYVIHVHGIKSALANLGRMDLSAAATKLESAGREGNLDTVISETPTFLDSLRAVAEELGRKEETASREKGDGDKAYLSEMLAAIRAACGKYDEKTADEALTALRKLAWPPQTEDLLATISEQLLFSDFDGIAEKINGIIGR